MAAPPEEQLAVVAVLLLLLEVSWVLDTAVLSGMTAMGLHILAPTSFPGAGRDTAVSMPAGGGGTDSDLQCFFLGGAVGVASPPPSQHT